jgi:hypothetical protein
MINYYEKFGNDLKDGNMGERTLVQYFKKWHGARLITYNNDILFDFILDMDGKEESFEVKTDRWEYFHQKQTGNIFVEVTHKGKPSGLFATIADYMAFFFPDDEECFVIKTSELRNLKQNQQGLFRRAERSGDEGRVTGYLINRHQNRHLFEVYHIPKHNKWKV